MIFGLLCILLWGLIPLVSTFGMQGLDHYQFLFWSSVVSFITLLALTAQAKQLKEFKQQKLGFWAYAIFLGLLGTFFYYLCLYQGYQYGSKIEVLSVQYTWPAWVIVLSLIVSKQRFNWLHGMIILSGMVSVLLVISKGDIGQLVVPDPSVLLWVMAGAVAFALFSVLSKSVLMSALPLNTLFFATATLISLFTMLSFSSFKLPNTQSLFPLLVNGLLVNGVSYYFWVVALRKTKPENLSLLTFLTPLVSVIYLVILMDEPLLPAYAVAFALVSISGMLYVKLSSKENR